MQRSFGFALLAALLLGGAEATAQSVLFDFQSGGDQGWGHKFSDDASETFPIVNIGGSNRMAVARTPGDFQEAERNSGTASEPFFMAMNAASANEAGYLISYDYYIDTAPGNFGTFLQLGTYVNTGSGYFKDDFAVPRDVELNATQLASGQVFSGTISETFAAKTFDMPTGQTFFRFGLIINGDGANQLVHYDNIRIAPVPEPASIGLAGLAGLALLKLRRRK